MEFRRPDGCRLHYETHGPAEADPLILLEGLGGDIPGWRRNIPHLARELFVIAYDFRGNGESDAPDEPVGTATFVEDTVALLDHLGIERVHVYGQSFGGMIAQELALVYPTRVRTLVLACTHCGGAHAERSDAHVPKDRAYLALYSPWFAEQHPERIAADLEAGSLHPQRPHAERRQWEAMQGFDSFGRLPRIEAPTLVLHGTEDLTVPVENARLLASRIPGAELVLLEGAGHLYHSEQPDAADAAVLDFIGRRRGA